MELLIIKNLKKKKKPGINGCMNEKLHTDAYAKTNASPKVQRQQLYLKRICLHERLKYFALDFPLRLLFIAAPVFADALFPSDFCNYDWGFCSFPPSLFDAPSLHPPPHDSS